MTLPNRAGYLLLHLVSSRERVAAAAAAAASSSSPSATSSASPSSPSLPSTSSSPAAELSAATATMHVAPKLEPLTHESSTMMANGASECEAHHALLPLVERLKQMIARPDKLLAAVTRTDPSSPTSSSTTATVAAHVADEHRLLLRTKAATFQRTELRELDRLWHRVATTDVHVSAATATTSRLDAMLTKLALLYMRLWSCLVATCIDAVVRMRAVLYEAQQLLHDRRHSPSATAFRPLLFGTESLDALSQRIVRAPALGKRSRLTRQSNEFMVGWFIAHKTNPYPSADERAQIAAKTGLTEQQVRNWFANMRKRHWKPSRASAKKPRCLIDVVLRQHDVQ